MYAPVATKDSEESELQEYNRKLSSEVNEEAPNKVEAIEDNKKDLNEGESQLEHVPYPKSVFFILSNEFCERFSYYGMRAILSLYLRDILLFSEKDSTMIYHAFAMLAYFFPILGAIIADVYIGKFRTILYLSIVYAGGNVLLALASATPLHIPQVPFSMVALILIALGTGGIKPCVSSFGGDQFVLPQQEVQLATFFSVYYFSINLGSLISIFLTPVLREDVQCFDSKTCFPLAFAVPGALMILSVVAFVGGAFMYKIRKPEGNVMVDITKCITNAVKTRKSSPKVDHWLDRSIPKYGEKLVSDVKTTLDVLVVYAPLPIFYALYEQQGSAWTFQASHMDGSLGSYTILPDQMQVVNPLLILAFIPLFNSWVYPALARCNMLRTPLQKMCCGGFLAAVAFVISAGVSFALEATYPVLPTGGNAQVRVFNPTSCNGTFEIVGLGEPKIVDAMDWEYINLDDLKNGPKFDVRFTADTNQPNCKDFTTTTEIQGAHAYFCKIIDNGLSCGDDDIAKTEDGLPNIRTIVANPSSKQLIYTLNKKSDELTVNETDDAIHSLSPGKYQINNFDTELEFLLGGVYTVLVTMDETDNVKEVRNIQITEPNSVHMLWLIPQYVIMTAAEIMFSITGLEFSYAEAPLEMKSVMSAAFLAADGIGNLIIIIIVSGSIFSKQSYDFLLYAGLMVLDMVLFMYIAMRYKYKNITMDEDVKKVEEDKEQ